MSIKAVLFDFGGVFTPSPFSALRAWCLESGLDPAVGLRIMLGPYDQDTDHPWHQLERGELSLGAAAERIRMAAAEQGIDLDLFKIFRAMGENAGVRADMVDKVMELRAAGYLTALITNNIKEYSDGWRAMISAGDLFDIIVDSSAVGMRKPDLRIYRLALHRLAVEPEESAFLDDAVGNIEAARAIGMHAILVEDDHTGALAELDRLLARS